MVKNPPANAGDVDSIPGLGRSPGGGPGNPLLAWRIPWTEKLRVYHPRGKKESDTTQRLNNNHLNGEKFHLFELEINIFMMSIFF